MFKPVSSRVSFPELEERILRLWREERVFARTQEKASPQGLFRLYEGPPTANASPGIHHVLSRVFKDVIPRYKTMKGYRAPRKGGWDTHGLPVELEVERKLGLATKPDIERYGIAHFNAACRESVMKYVQEWEALTERIGFWLDMEHPYRTFDNEYIESCWHIVKQLWDKGLVYEGHRVTPHCPRCVTSLSSHEVALGYQDEVEDPSVHIKFRLTQESALRTAPEARGEVAFLAWTTTPWTLPGNTALAVAPPAEYALVEKDGEGLILAQALVSKAGLGDWEVRATFPGERLIGLRYQPLYDIAPREANGYRVIGGNFVSMEDGTGIVHIAPAYGAEDYEVGLKERLPLVNTVDLEGRVMPTQQVIYSLPNLGVELPDKKIIQPIVTRTRQLPLPGVGTFVKEADEAVLTDLKRRSLLLRRETIKHTYPFCWRCGSPLLYYAKSSWYIKTTAVKDGLMAGNEQINWYPEHIKQGRFGDWLAGNVDWAISRERYWGTPLPIWRCSQPGCGHTECLGSVAELRARVGAEGMEEVADLHRPDIDRPAYPCPRCGSEMRRIPEVMDCWFDSGAMPFAQWHYPFENQDKIEPPGGPDSFFPADYICEAVDQTRGWFYSLHAISTLLLGQPSYKNVICLGHILDAQGEKMSKSKGTVVEPWAVISKYGADPLRWYFYTASPPGNSRRFSGELVAETVRRFFLTLWNTYSFFVTYANIDRFDPAQATPKEWGHPLDRWLLSELNTLIQEVDKALEGYDPTEAGRKIEAFVEGLSNWYVRRSRRRFWKSEDDADKRAAYAALHRCLATLARLLAPFAPFLAEEMYQNLERPFSPGAPVSVHLADFPQADPSLIDESLAEDMRLAVRVAGLGRAARSKAGLKVRQPLARVLVVARTPAEADALRRVASQILDELNVKALGELNLDEVSDYFLKPNFEVLGPKFGRALGEIRKALAHLSPEQVDQARSGSLQVGSHTLHLGEDYAVEGRPRAGWAVEEEGGLAVAVDTQITPELADEGLARELVHRLQTMRRSAGFEVADYIETYYEGDERLSGVLAAFGDYVRQETLSRRLVAGPPPADAYAEAQKLEGMAVRLGVRRV
ncbi:MAG: isoleucine--tRNA ligase [Chloroflexi bacterium]|nr:isoleucine--tRNA ligase [Chloroflexota bacterium]